MLVFIASETERIRLGDSIVGHCGARVGRQSSFGIEAPPDVLVQREELEKHVAAAVTPVNE